MPSFFAWFVCRGGGAVDDIHLPLRKGQESAPPKDIEKQGRMRAARTFKRRNEMHPCVRVSVEFQGVVPESETYQGGA